MPVEDHPVHPSTVQSADYRCGCHSANNPNRRASGYWAPDGYKVAQVEGAGERKVVLPVMRWIPHAMTTDCRHKVKPEAGCTGCEYAKWS